LLLEGLELELLQLRLTPPLLQHTLMLTTRPEELVSLKGIKV
jgi:hypothetical protein